MQHVNIVISQNVPVTPHIIIAIYGKQACEFNIFYDNKQLI